MAADELSDDMLPDFLRDGEASGAAQSREDALSGAFSFGGWDIPLTGLPGLDDGASAVTRSDDPLGLRGGMVMDELAAITGVQTHTHTRAAARETEPRQHVPPPVAAAPAPSTSSDALSLADIEAAMFAQSASAPAPPSASAVHKQTLTHVHAAPPAAGFAAGAPPPQAPQPQPGAYPPGYGAPGVPPSVPGPAPGHPGVAAMPHPHVLHPHAYAAMSAQLAQLSAMAARAPMSWASLPPHFLRQAQMMQVALQQHAAAVAHMHAHAHAQAQAAGHPYAGPPPGVPPTGMPATGGRATAPPAGYAGGAPAQAPAGGAPGGPVILARPSYSQAVGPVPQGVALATQPQSSKALTPAAPAPAPVAQRKGPTTLASILSHPIPRGLRGSRMDEREIRNVAKMMYTNIAAAEDPFAECYYYFALQAKKAAGTAGSAATAAQAAPSSNVLDVAALLSTFGKTAAPSSKPGAKSTGGTSKPSAGKELAVVPKAEAEKAPESSSSVDAAAVSAVASLPLTSLAQRNQARDLTQARLDQLARRRLWEQHSKVLGRVTSMSVRAPRQILTLSASGQTMARDIDRGTVKQALSGADVRRAAKKAGAITDVPEEASEPDAGAGDADATSIWLARAYIDDAAEAILSLQEAARRLQAYLRLPHAPPGDVMLSQREHVARRRATLARFLGLRKLPAPAAPVATAEEPAFTPLTPLPRLPVGDTIADDVIAAIVSLPKGKQLLVRAVPMLHAADRAAIIAAGMRHLPHFVACAVVGPEAEAADAALAAALASWIKSYAPAPDMPASCPSPRTLMACLTLWCKELHAAHDGAIIRALLQHPGAGEIISAALFRGEEEATRLCSAPGLDGKEAEATAEPPEVQAWREVTQALGKAFVEAE